MLALIWAFVSALEWAEGRFNSPGYLFLISIISRLLFSAVGVVFFQSLYNYAFFFYYGEGCLNSISLDYNLRSTQCYFDAILAYADLKFSFASLF